MENYGFFLAFFSLLSTFKKTRHKRVNYISYINALSVLRLQTLQQRRKTKTLRFIQRSLADGNLHDLFHKRKEKQHNMQTRTTEEFKVLHANTGRFQNSPILTMQREPNKAKK